MKCHRVDWRSSCSRASGSTNSSVMLLAMMTQIGNFKHFWTTGDGLDRLLSLEPWGFVRLSFSSLNQPWWLHRLCFCRHHTHVYPPIPSARPN